MVRITILPELWNVKWFVKCLQVLVLVLVHGMTHRAHHHVVQAGMTVQVVLAQALAILAQAGQIALAQVLLAQTGNL